MINFNDVTGENVQKHPNWPQITNHRYRILISGGSGSGKANILLNLTSHQPDLGKIYLLANGSFEAKYQLLINKSESSGLKH